MTDTYISADAFFAWHDWVRVIALVLLSFGALYAVFEYLLASRVQEGPWAPGRNSLRTRIIIGLLVVGVVPAMSLGLFLAERSAHLRQDRLVGGLEESAIATAGAVDQFIDKHRAGIITAASAASASGTFNRESLTRWLLLYHETYSDFLTMLSTDSDGNVTAATSNMTGFLSSVPELVSHNVADRPYFQGPMESGGFFISKVFRGRNLGSDPIVAVSAPLLGSQGKRLGIIEGSLDLSAFKDFDDKRVHLDRSEMIMVDQSDRVIYASSTAGLIQLESIASDPMITSAVTAGKGYEYVAQSHHEQHRFVSASATTQNGWTVYFRAPLAQISQQMLSDYLVSGFSLLTACVLALLLGGGIVRRVTRSVADMNRAIANFSMDGSEDMVLTPHNTPSEFHPIFKHMRKRSSALKRTHKRLSNSIEAGVKLQSELTQSVSLKEVEIAERTAELEDANRRLSDLSKIDELTGIPNRRGFDSFTQRVWKVSIRERRPITLIMIDIDSFKAYNDNLGHQAGDDCLYRVAQALKSSVLRPLDLVARYGGEEFVAVLGHTNVTEALIVADRMRSKVAELQIAHTGSPYDVVTVSVGVVSIEPTQATDYTQVLKHSDEALYEAKAAGRNCVVHSQDGIYVKFAGETQASKKDSVVPIRACQEPTF